MQKILLALAAAAFTPTALADDTFSLSAGFDYSAGRYGARQSTRILFLPVTARYESDDNFLKLTVPYISITGPGGVVRGIGIVHPARVRTATVTNSGLGDVTASAGHTAYSGDALSLDLVGNIKFGTADATKDLGTGKNDYSAEIDGYYALGQATLFGTAGYKVYGSPAGITLKDTPYGSLGVNRKLSETERAGIMLDVAKSPSASSGDQREVTLFVSEKASSASKVQLYILKGFASGSPKIGFGAVLTGYF